MHHLVMNVGFGYIWKKKIRFDAAQNDVSIIGNLFLEIEIILSVISKKGKVKFIKNHLVFD